MDKEWIIVKANYARILSTSQKILYPFVILLNLVRQRLKYSSATASSKEPKDRYLSFAEKEPVGDLWVLLKEYLPKKKFELHLHTINR